MINDADNPETQAEWDLLHCLFPKDLLYPWNPYTVEAEVYFLEQDAEDAFGMVFTEAELADRSERFMGQINQVWSSTRLQTSLLERFSPQIPDELLNRLVRVATRITEQVSLQGLSLADQLVHCVQELLPQWSEEDLQVLARPFAYAMRGGEMDAGKSNPVMISTRSWSELSEIEQARTCFGVARYALLEVLSEREIS